MPVGVHTSIAGGLHLSIGRAAELGCETFQIFSRNPRSWAFTPIPGHEAALFRKTREKAGIGPVIVHTTYLINLCAPDDVNFDKSLSLFRNEIASAEALGAEFVVTHLGSPQDLGREFAVRRVLEALKEVAAAGLGKGGTMVLLENTSGGGSGFGSSLKDMGEILDGAEEFGLRAGLCFDTCHAFAAGYPLLTEEDAARLAVTIEAEAGLERLKAVHLNDSKGAAGSRLDRHEHIGRGKIPFAALKAFINHPAVVPLPLILETPKKKPEDDPMNLRTVREIRAGKL